MLRMHFKRENENDTSKILGSAPWEWIVDRRVSLHGDGDHHEDGASHKYRLEIIQCFAVRERSPADLARVENVGSEQLVPVWLLSANVEMEHMTCSRRMSGGHTANPSTHQHSLRRPGRGRGCRRQRGRSGDGWRCWWAPAWTARRWRRGWWGHPAPPGSSSNRSQSGFLCWKLLETIIIICVSFIVYIL